MRARLRWQGHPLNSGYRLRYREQAEGAQWFEENSSQTYVTAMQMKPGVTYQYEVCGVCDFYESDFTPTETFTTLAENPNAFSCGDASTVPAPDGSPPLPALFINDFIKAGGYDVVVTKATGSNGVFTGEGLAVVPWFHSAKVRVTFQNIGVNQSYQLTRGEIKSVWDPNSRFLIESEKTLAEGGGKGLEATLSYFEADELIEVEGVILNVFVNPDGDIVVQTNGGEQVVEREEGKTYALADGAGNGYLVDEEGKVTKTTATEALAAGERGEREYNTSASKSVRFLRTDQTKYGWDEYRAQVLDQHYQTVENGDHITWKALVTGQPETIGFEAADKGMKIDFKREGMSQTVLEPNGEWLTLTGTTAGWHEEVVAYEGAGDASAPPLVLGKHYPLRDKIKIIERRKPKLSILIEDFDLRIAFKYREEEWMHLTDWHLDRIDKTKWSSIEEVEFSRCQGIDLPEDWTY